MQLKEAGQSLWLDNVQRGELQDGTIKGMIEADGVCGVTSNPTIFMNAVTKSRDYDGQILDMLKQSKSPEEIYYAITVDDIRQAGELFLRVFEQTGGQDGFVSIEVNPHYAHAVDETIAEARRIVADIGLPNIMVKVPATEAGVTATEQLIAEGVNVNVTLLFSPQRYEQIARAYIRGLERRAENGDDLSRQRSVASFFISRIDTKVDGRIDRSGSDSLAPLRGRAALSVGGVTYMRFQSIFDEKPFAELQRQGARLQRLLWASTGTKDPAYSDVKYVEGLIASDTINTLPPKTIDAFRDHGDASNSIEQGLGEAPAVLRQLEGDGISMESIYNELEQEGVQAFIDSYDSLLEAIKNKAGALAAQAEG